MERITILQFTDPICVWCWGNEPTMRAIEFLYSGKVRIEYIMGGLIEDICSLYDINGEKEAVIKKANAIMKRNWRAAAERHGMPVVESDVELFTERYPSSFPQNIAYETAKRINPSLANRFLRLMREATFVGARRTSQIDTLIDLATQAGYNAAEFLDEYTTGNAHSDFMHDRMLCRRNGITGFPSYLIKNDDTEIILGGYQNLNTFHTIIKRLSSGRIRPRRLGPSIANMLEFVKQYHSIYPIDIETLFALDRFQCEQLIKQLIESHKLVAEKVGSTLRLTLRPHHTKPRLATKRGDKSQKTTLQKPNEA